MGLGVLGVEDELFAEFFGLGGNRLSVISITILNWDWCMCIYRQTLSVSISMIIIAMLLDSVHM